MARTARGKVLKVKELVAQLILFSEPDAEVIIQWGHAQKPLNNITSFPTKKMKDGSYRLDENGKIVVILSGDGVEVTNKKGNLYA